MIGGHGGNIYELARQLECLPAEIVDMSANVNPLGPMPELVAYLADNLAAISVLPEAAAETAVRAFADFHDVDPGMVMAGNGTTELIYRIPRAVKAKKALVVGPTYADYKDACTMNHVACDHMILEPSDDFSLDMESVAAIDADLVFICNPNNPTGTLTDRSDIEALCRTNPETLFLIDESYLPFADAPEQITMIGSDLPNVMVLNSMSKAFRIPGLRIGFVKAPGQLVDRLTPYALPWSVNGLAQAAVTWLMTHPEKVNPFLEHTRSMIRKEKSWVVRRLAEESDIRCFPSATTFILMALPEHLTAAAVWQHMAKNRILIRDCSNFTGLSERYVRLSLRKEGENLRATELLIDFCRSGVAGPDRKGKPRGKESER